MSNVLKIHHIRYSVKNISEFLQLLKVQLQFYPYASRCKDLNNLAAETIVVRHKDATFIVDKRQEGKLVSNDNSFCWGNNVYPVDTACDICLQCSNIPDILDKVLSYDKSYVKASCTSISDEYGTVKYAVIKSPIGNVQHTLIDLSDYKGPFLPGFKLFDFTVEPTLCEYPDFIQTIDHVAFALCIGQTDAVMQWYNHCIGFNRLIINEDEDEKEGYVVQEGSQGLRLKAAFAPLQEFGKCHEAFSGIDPDDVPKFVFGEALSVNYTDQVSFFIDQHHGSGVQHIAFGTKDIVKAISYFKKQGLKCVLPPDSYYNEPSKEDEIQKLQYEIDTLKSNNILLESYLNSTQSNGLTSFKTDSSNIEEQLNNFQKSQWFIMQAFTSPVFHEKTLFFEIIQRFQTMSGFGAGNIGALWRAVQKELF